MLESKLFEIRDRATYIPVVATLLTSENPIECYHLRRAGFDLSHPLVMVTRLVDGKGSYADYHWGSDTRTMPVAHKYIQEHWKTLVTGDVIDVEYISGETEQPAESEAAGIAMIFRENEPLDKTEPWDPELFKNLRERCTK